ncbi:MAG: YbaB/EbfC family nucleoid-associated protein [Pseudomonadota bacterium]|jgi:nucleoid-associated protein EbfC|nr:YbaB/EbfC family nucleoid-associated protein [Alphaproteobacteria bacterium]
MKDMAKLFQQAQEMQARMGEMQAKMAEMEARGVAGGGMVAITLNGQNQMRKVEIAPSLLRPEEAEILEDLIAAAHHDAKSRLDALLQEEMSKLTGGLKLPPGFKLPF